MKRDEIIFKNYKILIGIVFFLIGFSIFLLPSWLDITISNPGLANFIQTIGSFLSATVAVAFIHRIFVKEYEETHLLQSIRNAVEQSISPMDCRQCSAILCKCEPNSFQCKRIQETLLLDDIISLGETMRMKSYEVFLENIKQRLFESTESLHVMALSRESLRNFYYYDNTQSNSRGDIWRDYQVKWVKNNEKNGIKRIAIIKEEDIVDHEYRQSLQKILIDYDNFCDLRLCDLKKVRQILNEPYFVARDFGVFINNSELSCAFFTFISVYDGNSFVKSAGNEYFTISKRILFQFQEYFLSIWNNNDLNRDSDVLLKTIGVRSDK